MHELDTCCIGGNPLDRDRLRAARRSPRCSAKSKRSGLRCKRPASRKPTGGYYEVCSMHGAGTKARPGGRPIEHGMYSEAPGLVVQLVEHLLLRVR